MFMIRPAFAFVLLFAAEAAFAAVRVPQDHKTIQAAVDAASSGDVVLVTDACTEEAAAALYHRQDHDKPYKLVALWSARLPRSGRAAERRTR